MQKKTIKKTLAKKFKEFVKSIDDENVRNLVKENSIITGGCIASMLLGEEVNDYDIYFSNKETTKAVANYYVKKYNKHCDKNLLVLDGGRVFTKEEMEEYGDEITDTPLSADRIKIFISSNGVAYAKQSKEKYFPIFLSENAITLNDGVQLIIRFYGDHTEIHKNFDFVHCTNYWIPNMNEGELFLNQEALEALLSRTLDYTGSLYPIASVIRTRKFINRGWRINAGQYLKMAFQISKLNLEDIYVLQEQLVGVDSSYFHSFINRLKADQNGENSPSLESSYVAKLVDEIFNS